MRTRCTLPFLLKLGTAAIVLLQQFVFGDPVIPPRRQQRRNARVLHLLYLCDSAKLTGKLVSGARVLQPFNGATGRRVKA